MFLAIFEISVLTNFKEIIKYKFYDNKKQKKSIFRDFSQFFFSFYVYKKQLIALLKFYKIKSRCEIIENPPIAMLWHFVYKLNTKTFLGKSLR